MVSTFVSALALAWAIAPQVSLSLQAVADDLAVDTALEEMPEPRAETVRSEVLPEQAPRAEGEDETAAPDAIEPMEAIEETPVDTAEIAEPVETKREQPAVEANASGQVPEAEWPAILERVSGALSEAKTAKGQFIQTNIDGSLSTGSFALNRPGRVRFEYDDPTPVLIVSDGTTVAIEDRDLETVDRVPIGSTPLGLILSPRLDVNDDVEILGVFENADRIGVRVSDASGELEGTLTMVFDKTSYELLGWLAVDGNLQTTVVDLVNIETNVRIDPRLFRLNEDDDEDDER
ncbi:MAG: outer-membrane lipoprotein carrier protein LolA [Pseudomonadota bacterium]